MPTLREKLDMVRFMRPYYPWLMGLGISKKTIGDIKAGQEPDSEALFSALVHCENVSRKWLTDDIGPPFQVVAVANDDECSEALSSMLDDEQWTVHLLDDGYDKLIVLTQPGQHARPRSGFIDYTIVEILPNVGDKSVDIAHIKANILKTLTVSPEVLENIKTGNVGTYRLADSEQPSAILSRAEIVPISKRKKVMQQIKASADINETSNLYDVHHSPVDNDEDILVKNYRLLTDENKKLVQQLTRNLR